MFKFLRRQLAERRYPPGYGTRTCAGCGHLLHNRDWVIKEGPTLLHARLRCVWKYCRDRDLILHNQRAVPYLEAMELVKPGTFS